MNAPAKTKTPAFEQPGFVSGYLLYLLAAASEAASKQFHTTVREKGLRITEWRVMACLYDQDGLMITELAHYALMEQSRITRIIDQMETDGLVARYSDEGDGRRVRIYLTDRGQTLGSELVEAARLHESKLLESLPGKHAGNIKPALLALLTSLEAASDSD